MEKRRIFMMTILAFLLLTGFAFAEDIYVAQTSRGSDTGADAANAHSIAWLNDASNWGAGAGKVSAGDTVRLYGTFTSTLQLQGSGSAGSPITILFESGAKFSNSTWTKDIISMYRQSYIIVDGGANGIIEATNNGTNLTYQNGFAGVYIVSSNHIEVKNLTIQNLFIHKQNAAGGECENVGVDTGGSTVSSNISIHDNTLTWSRYAVFWVVGGSGSNAYIYNNSIRYCNATVFAMASGTFTGVYFYNNTFGDPYPWDDAVNNDWHHEAFHYWGSGLTGLYIYGNYLYGDWGNYYTAGFFLEDSATRIVIYNNIAVMPYVRKIYTKIGTQHIIANNTFVNSGYSIDCGGYSPTVTWQNNIEYGTDGRNCPVSDNHCLVNVNPVFVNPANTTSGNYRLQSSSPAINAGSSSGLTSYFTTDADGNTRSGTWDIGAYEYGSAAPAPSGSAPAPPASLRVE
jgi:hypothetical protein